MVDVTARYFALFRELAGQETEMLTTTAKTAGELFSELAGRHGFENSMERCKVAINDEYTGLVYGNQIYDKYHEGQKLKGYITGVRDDGRIDVSLQPDKGRHVHSTFDKILNHLKAVGGKSEFGDKSSPEDIKREFQVSKKVFKQAIGGLY